MNSVGKSLLNKSIALVSNCISYSHLNFKKEKISIFFFLFIYSNFNAVVLQMIILIGY